MSIIFLRSITVWLVFLSLSSCELLGNSIGHAKEFLSVGEAISTPATVPVYQTNNPRQKQWVDSVIASMSLQQRIGQLFMVAAYSNKGSEHINELESQVRNQHIGGLIFFQGGPQRQAKMTNQLQAAADIPLMVGIDGEWGLQMRLQDSIPAFPRQMTLGAHPDESLIKQMGLEIARQCKRLGIHINFAPDIDVNSNPANPVIGIRSFGENKENVALKGIAYMKGMQEGGILACGKHFPGHGDTDKDSHYDLPVVNRTKKQLEDIDLYPFRRLAADSLASVMVAHLFIPSLDKTANRPTTLSPTVITHILRKQMGFQGLVFTDALNMKGASKYAAPGQLEVQALLAGNDVLLFPTDVKAAVKAIEEAISAKKLREKDIEEHVRRILAAKWWCGLERKPVVDLNSLQTDLTPLSTQALINQCYRSAVTVVRDPARMVPFKNIDTCDFASLSIGADKGNGFQQTLSKYTKFEHYSLGKNANVDAIKAVESQFLKSEGPLVVAIHKLTGKASDNYGLGDGVIPFLQRVAQKRRLVIVSFGNPYALKIFTAVPAALLCGYEDVPAAQSAVAQALFGAGVTAGRLPITLAINTLPEGSGIFTPDARRFGFSLPEEVGLDSKKLSFLDSLASYAVKSKITPGCQMVVARRGKVIYNKSFGGKTYPQPDSLGVTNDSVTNNTLYDIASITKVAGTLQAVMILHDQGLLDVSQTLGNYLPELAGSNKADIVLADVLSHQAGLLPYIPFWERTVKSVSLTETFYCTAPDSCWFNKQVAPGIFSMYTIEDSVIKWIALSPLLAQNRRGAYDYKYSDLGFILMKRIVEKLINQPVDEFLAQNLFAPLGMQTMGYQPLAKFDAKDIAPTEKDQDFRGQLIRGTVHDQTAALLGGVAGHAGIFSNAYDLAILMQMNMQDGEYGGQLYIQNGTVPYFGRAHFSRNRRGLGWDKPMPKGQSGATSPRASQSTFGHTGFTGTCAWADPEQELVFVFLCNRVNPTSDNQRLITDNIRPRLHDIVYQSIKDSSALARN